jgi:hypothetical protein
MGLQVNANIPYGNACDLSVGEADGWTEVGFAPDPHGGPECLWFCFRLEQDGSSDGTTDKIRLALKHAHNMLGGNRPENMRPVVRYAESDWKRLGAPQIADLPDGRNRVVWTIEAPRSYVDVAYCYPYGRPDMDALVHETDGYWRADVIGVSQMARPLVRLSNAYGEIDGDRPGLYVVARQHSGETPGSWVLDGLLRHMASLGHERPLVWAVPLANVDGVEGGDYGKDNFPYDLNRAWGQPPMRHEVLVFKRDIQRWKARCRPALAIDLHAPGACETGGIYCYVPSPTEYPDLHQEILGWTAALKSALGAEYAAKTFERVADYPSRWETPNFSRYFWAQGDICSFGIETPYAMVGDLVLTRERYREAGARIADGILSRLVG